MIKMGKYLTILVVFQLFYFTYLDAQKKHQFFRKDYRYFDKTRSFYKYHKAHRNWLSAKKRCTSEGASLWYPEDQAEVDLMVQLWKEKLPSELVMYVGISDLLSEGTFETVDGKLVEEVWNHWGHGEPNNNPNYGGEDCGVIRRNDKAPGGLDLSDQNCANVLPFICKKTLDSLEWNVLCDLPDKHYIYESSTGKCYKFHRTPTNWQEAHSTCSAEQSYLAVINSIKEKKVFVKLTKNAHIEKVPGNSKFVNLGFHNRFGEGWQTVTGTALDLSGYNVWAEGQPDGDANQQCGAMSVDGLYHDIWCDYPMAFFICEHDIKNNKSLN